MNLDQDNANGLDSTAGSERNFNDLAPAPRSMSSGSKLFLIFRFAWIGALFFLFAVYININPSHKNGTGTAYVLGLIGAVLTIAFSFTGIRTVRYFMTGNAAKGKMTNYNEYQVRTKHGYRTDYNAEFTYEVNGVKYQRNLKGRTKKNNDLVLDEVEETVIYLEDQPQKAMLIDEHGVKIVVDQLGRIEVKNAWAGYLFFLLFVLAVVLIARYMAGQI